MTDNNVIITCSTPNREWLYNLTNQTKSNFCKQFGYDFIFRSDIVGDASYRPGWNKIVMINEYLPYYKWLIWLDDDAGIIRFDEDFIDKACRDIGEKSFGICRDKNGLNSGVMFIRNNAGMLWMFKTIWENRRFYKNDNHGYPGLMEQPAIIELTNKIGLNHVCILDGRLYNAYDKRFTISEPNQANESSYILHIANGGQWKDEHRQEIIEAFS